MPKSDTSSRIAKGVIYLLLLASALLSIGNMRAVKRLEKPRHETAFPWTEVDSFPVWVGGRMILHRVNPYTTEATKQIQIGYFGRPLTSQDGQKNPMIYAYPPQTPFVLLPLILLPWRLASLAFVIASIGLVALIGPIWLRVLHIDGHDLVTVICIMASWPALWGIRVENPSMVVIPAMAIAVWLYSRQRDTSAGILLALTTIKPQLCWLLILWLLIHASVHGRKRFIVGLCGTGAALAMVAYLWLPGSFRAWHGSFNNYLEPTKMYVPFPWLVAFLMLLLIPSLYKLRNDFGGSVALVLAVTTAAIPTSLWTTYNYLLLVPACILIIRRKGFLARLALAFIAIEYLLPCVAGIIDLRGSHLFGGLPGINTLLPVLLALSLIPWASKSSSPVPVRV